ncbi:NAD(P)H-dependent oxidoreductase [Stenotrophomonas geniculata]|uniref:NAD(P)H-dependent oxidoreductase n=1 Tax=Stenotrophomonas geniculata TaxID=86188 RepID=UPI00234F4B9F|nr:NAD(P)H-dependent oxidoreductase [Stenotrophomonas geniculata]MDC7801502.1 NAD(P)H-dependent oxidoreductase [Stenotrophomonas geniculata]
MSKVLVLKSSLNGAVSRSASLIKRFLAERGEHGFTDQVIERDLTLLDLPVLDSEIFHALRGAENPPAHAETAIHQSDALIAELMESDLVLIAAPMYNLNVPTPLKNWFDLVARAKVTFRYTETYPQGLVEGVKAVVFSPRGGLHLGQDTDAVTPYLKSVLGLIGITEVDFVYAEGLDILPHGAKEGMAHARDQVSALVQRDAKSTAA